MEQIELPAKLLDYFLWNNKSNINQNLSADKAAVAYAFTSQDTARERV